MKRYLICSDIHGRLEFFKTALHKQDRLDGVIIAGDLQLDTCEITEEVYKYFPNNTVIHMVSGNCDAYEPSAGLLFGNDTFAVSESHKVFLTHGHRYHVPQTYLLTYAAQEAQADIVIFGHTHCVMEEREDGILFLNPGALKDRSYMIMEITDNEEIVVKHCFL